MIEHKERCHLDHLLTVIIALISFGYHNVFPHVGRNVKIRAPNGRDVPILVTGTFGGADFIHSLMGEATDHLSEVSSHLLFFSRPL